jgi:hypothetical protein
MEIENLIRYSPRTMWRIGTMVDVSENVVILKTHHFGELLHEDMACASC